MKVKLPAEAATLLKSALTAPGWATTIQHIHHGGNLACKHLANVSEESGKAVNLDVSPEEIEAARHCITVHVGKGQIIPGKPALDLFEALEIKP